MWRVYFFQCVCFSMATFALQSISFAFFPSALISQTYPRQVATSQVRGSSTDSGGFIFIITIFSGVMLSKWVERQFMRGVVTSELFEQRMI